MSGKPAPSAEEGNPPDEPMAEAEASSGAASFVDEGDDSQQLNSGVGRGVDERVRESTADILTKARRQAVLLPPSASDEEVAATEAQLAPQSVEAARLTRAAGQHGAGTGIQFAGLIHIVGVLRTVFPDLFAARVVEGEFVVHSPDPKIERIAFRKTPHMDDRDLGRGGVATGKIVHALSETAEWIQVEGGLWLPKEYLKPAPPRCAMTTSDLIKACIQPATVPPNFIVQPEVTNADNAWYTHHYFDVTTMTERVKDGNQPAPPPNTYSLCAKLASNPATAHFIGEPTHFVSHAHTMSWEETLSSLESYVSKLPPEAVANIYFWIDGFSIDQHECQYSPPSIDDNSAAWANTFQQAIRQMGNVVMVMNPWDGPLVLSRLWCLWELHCAINTSSGFAICLSPQQEEAFCASLGAGEEFGETAIKALARVDVNKAQGHPKDKEMIMGGIAASPGGAEALNEAAVKQLRELFVGATARDFVDSQRSPDGSLETEKAILAATCVAGLLGRQLGHWQDAKALWEEAVAGWERLRGPDSKAALVAKGQLAGDIIQSTNQVEDLLEARRVYEEVLEKLQRLLGPDHADVLVTKANLANLLRTKLPDYAAALQLEDAVVTGFTKLYGLEHARTLRSMTARATCYSLLGRHSEAKAGYETALEGQRAMPQLGPRHPVTIYTQENLARVLYTFLGEQEQALRLMREVLEVRTTVLGESHPDTERVARTLAGWERMADPGHVEAMVLGAVVVYAGVGTPAVPADTVGEIVEVVEVRDGEVVRCVRFPGVIIGLRPQDLVLATPAQVAQWKATKAELDAQNEAHIATLVVGAIVTLATKQITTNRSVDPKMGSVMGEIIAVEEDGLRRIQFLGANGYGIVYSVPVGRLQDIALASPEQAAQWTTTKAELDAKAAAELSLVRKIFAMFDVDADGLLSKEEYRSLSKGIGTWGTDGYTDAAWDSTWLRDCALVDCSSVGMTAQAFELLYSRYRPGMAQADLDSCNTWWETVVSGAPKEAPEVSDQLASLDE